MSVHAPDFGYQDRIKTKTALDVLFVGGLLTLVMYAQLLIHVHAMQLTAEIRY